MFTILRNFVSIFEDTGAILFDIYIYESHLSVNLDLLQNSVKVKSTRISNWFCIFSFFTH